MVTLTPAARRYLREMAGKVNVAEDTPLRLGITREGCEGSGTPYRYVMGFETTPARPDDEVFESEGLRVLVDRESLPHLSGLALDLQEDGTGRRLTFRNPNAGHTCGCGHTFAPHGAKAPAGPERIRERVIEVLKSCYDPEIPVNIYDLGMIYGIQVGPDGSVAIRMTLTSPACPVAESLPPDIEHRVAGIEGVPHAKVEVVWDPPWTPDNMSEAAKLTLGM